MKSKLLLLLIISFIFSTPSCKKETLTNPVEVAKPAKGFIEQARTFLSSNYTASALSDLSIDASTLYKLDSGRYIIRVPLKTDGVKNFILLSADSIRGIKKSVLLNIDKTSNTSKGEQFTGTITIKEMNGKIKEVREILNGFRVSNNPNGRVETYVLQEVFVTSYVYNGGIGWADWLNLLDLSGGGGDFYGFNYADTPSGGGGSGSSYEPDPNTFEVEFESLVNGPAIDLNKFFNCFNQISDAGASFSVKLCVDIPVNDHPLVPVDLAGSPGHTFLTFTKTNGSESVTQSFGFYPDSWLNITGFPVSSKIEDNGEQYHEHEYNASIVMNNITSTEFDAMLILSTSLANAPYTLAGYNCTAYALDVFNFIRTNPIVPDGYDAPFYGLIPYSPQGLYTKLEADKNAGMSGITVGGVSKAPTSHGPCN